MDPPQNKATQVNSSILYANITNLFPGEEYKLSIVAVSENDDVQASGISSDVVRVLTRTSGRIMLPEIGFLFMCWLLVLGPLELKWNLLVYFVSYTNFIMSSSSTS